MSSYSIAVVPGDGVGQEVTSAGLTALEAAAGEYGIDFEFSHYDLGGERYLRTGEVLPTAVQDELARVDAILFGAIGIPDVPPGVLERGLLLKLRFDFDQYVNLRPVKLYPGVPTPIGGLDPDKCDLIVVRENTEGLYAGAGGLLRQGTAHEVATQESINTRMGVERVVRFAFEGATRRRSHVTLCHKTNVLNFAGDLWQRTFDEVGADYPSVETAYVHVDAACLYLINDPGRFDVVVTDNLFGDIITDLGAAVQGGLGLAASGNLNPTGDFPSMFEPVHGSAPDIAGKGWANPIASILSMAMCLDHLGERDAAMSMESAAISVLGQLRAMAGPDMGMSTPEIGHAVADLVGH